MGDIFQQVQSTLIGTPGNLAYHVIIAFSIAWVFQISMSIHHEYGMPQSKRLVWGVSAMLTGRIVLSISAALAAQGLIDYYPTHPLLDRMVTVLSLVIITWLWAVPERSAFEDTAAAIMGLGTFAFFIFSLVWWNSQTPGQHLNDTWLNTGWESLALIAIAVGVFLILERKPHGWGFALSLVAISAFGHFHQLAYPLPGEDLPGIVRLAQIAAYPLLISLPQRFKPEALQEALKFKQSFVLERRKYGAHPELFESILSLTNEFTLEGRNLIISRAIAESMLSDVCLVAAPAQVGEDLYIYNGYDLIREQTIDSTYLQADQIGVLSNALVKGKPVRLFASSKSTDLSAVAASIQVENPGNLLAAPIIDKDNVARMSVILLTPYSQRRWTGEDEKHLVRICEALGKIQQRTQEWASIQETQPLEVAAVKLPLDKSQFEDLDLPEEIVNITPEYVISLKEENTLLKHLVSDLEKSVLDQESKNDATHGELRLALEEIARLGDELTDLLDNSSRKQRVEDYTKLDEDELETFSGIAEDLRRPMASIVGYTDLLVGESIGILGAMQKKFMERIKISTQRMEAILDDLLMASGKPSFEKEISRQSVNLSEVINEVASSISEQLSVKSIDLKKDIAENIPEIRADTDALHQVFLHLLTNAGLVTPIGGTISLELSRHSSEDNLDYASIQITDQGGGIPINEIYRVFSRLRDRSSPIQGVGETGVGLSIARALIEAHNGRIWADSEMDVGTTFSLLLPLNQDKPIESRSDQ